MHDQGGRVYVVADDDSFRATIEQELRRAGYEVATYPWAHQLRDRLDRLPDESDRSCILLDVRIPGLSGLDIEHSLNELGSRLPIVCLAEVADVPTSIRAIKAGAEDFLVKPIEQRQLFDAIERALARRANVSDKRQTAEEMLALAITLTPRERKVLELVVRGKLSKQIAQELGTSERTVRVHRHHLMEKMKVQSLAELVAIVERFDLVSQRKLLSPRPKRDLHRS
nr:LuxR C-terminal-related transcriptional regulator [uncultured Bradyrhizobium sp.]